MASDDLNRHQALADALTVIKTRDEPENLLDLINPKKWGDSSLDWAAVRSVFENHSETAQEFIQAVVRWDNQGQTVGLWMGETQPKTEARRECIMDHLGASSEFAAYIQEKKPVSQPLTSMVAEPSTRVWYTPKRQNECNTYWRAYRDYLMHEKGWGEDAVDSIDAGSTAILERLADPREEESRRTKGLVVGYVQSGKTANFAAVISKAVDAGYRLVIVLTGMQELLRQQTQRRLDMEVVGVKNILGDMASYEAEGMPQGEYLDDEDWEDFSRILEDPFAPKIMRVTTYKSDVREEMWKDFMVSMPGGDSDPGNQGVHVRLVVTKKNAKVLEKLNNAIKSNEKVLADLPTLLIDDESDQASPNTAKPNYISRDDQEHKMINAQIIEMRRRLRRCQYVAYTATPFANVLIDVEDDQDLFPDDFILALDKPAKYMGAQAFVPDEGFDDSTDEQPHPLVRYIEDADDSLGIQDDELASALALYVMSGCVKLFRQDRNPELAKSFRHHTMLVHTTHKKVEHNEDEAKVQALWHSIDWLGESSEPLLRRAFDDLSGTFLSDESTQNPTSLEEVLPYVRQCLEKIESPLGLGPSGQVTIVVNSEQQAEKLDFTRTPTWKVVIGGNKLSRGFTVEGLTTTWFMRSPQATDTLTQMARWYGFRHGYEDLVRLFLPRALTKGKRTVNMYEAFCASADEEEAFRAELRRYAGFGEESVVRPKDIPPLVYSFLGWMTPAAKAKMQWAKVAKQGDNRWSPKLMGHSDEDLKTSWPAWQRMLKILNQTPIDVEGFDWYAGTIDLPTLHEAMMSVRWFSNAKQSVESHLSYMKDLKKEGLQSDFALFLPQLRSPQQYFDFPELGRRKFAIRKVPVTGEHRRFQEYTKPEDMRLATSFVEDLQAPDSVRAVVEPRDDRGVILAYLIPDSDRIRKLIDEKVGFDRVREECSAEDFTVGLQFLSSKKVISSKNQGRAFVVERVEA